MSAFNQDEGRHDGRGREARAEATATGERKPVTARISVKGYNPTGETQEQRRERHALATGTRRSLWL